MESMDLVQRIKSICKERGISVSRLERECGFANAYITNLRAGKMPADRLQKVADYFGVSTKFLLTGEDPDEDYYSPEAKEIMQDIHDREDLRALFHVAKKSSPEYVEFVRDFLQKLLEKESDR